MDRAEMIALAAAVAFAVSPEMSDAEVAARAAEEFRLGVEARQTRGTAQAHFRAAADHFEELRRRGVAHAALYRNLGNASVLADDLPHAILAYRRGLRLAPGDADLTAGLAEARSRVARPNAAFGRPPEDGGPPWAGYIGAGCLFAAAVAAYVAACCCLTRWLMTRRVSFLSAAIGALIVAGVPTALLLGAVWDERSERDHPLVVIAEDGVLLRKGDGPGFPPRYETPLNKGVEGRLLFRRGDWVQIELTGGEVGWTPHAKLLMDER
jgi:hypothetical protein